jgi:TonB family protein
MFLFRARFGVSHVLAPIALFPALALGQTLAENGAGTAPPEAVATEVLVAPHVKSIDAAAYWPREELQYNHEGWAQLGFMVDTQGKPFEITVVDSSGDSAFEHAAVKAMENAKIEAGTLNGQPVESAYEFKLVFLVPDSPAGANRHFVHTYDNLLAAIKANNRAAADAAVKGLTITNLYEDAYFGLASYQYARVWGDETQQLSGLKRAIARDHSAHYLHKIEFEGALLEMLKIELKDHQYSEATTTWNDLQQSGIDFTIQAQLKPVFDRLNKLRSDNTEYDVAGSMPDGTWQLALFKKHFRAKVTQGRISDVKLRCAKGFVRFAFDPDLQFNVESKYGSCRMELEGERGTQFVLTQF